MSNHRGLCCLAFLACGAGAMPLLACGIERVVVTGAYVDYGHSPDLQPCGGNAVYTDDFAPFVIDLLGIQGFRHAAFTWTDADEFGSGPLRSCAGNIGCALKDQAYSRSPIHLHEVAHTIMYFVNHRPLPFLQEGIAVALDMPSGLTLSALQANGPQAADPRSELMKRAEIDYDKAGLFTLYLLQIHGVDKFITLYRRSRREAEADAVSSLFEDVYGQSVDELVGSFLDDNSCPSDVDLIPWYDCEAAGLEPSDQGGWQMERFVDCTDADVFGGLATDFGVHVVATFEVEEPGIYQVQFDGPSRALAHVGQCGGCRWLAPQVVINSEQTEAQYLYRGTYFVAMRIFEDENYDAKVTITPFP